jgi:ATP-dependent protease ClpP protease subunit
MAKKKKRKSPKDVVSSRFEVKINNTKNKEGEPTQTAVIDIEGAIGWDIDNYYDEIPQNDTPTFKKRLEELEGIEVSEILVNIINSPGGNVADGIAIHDFLKSYKAKITTNVIGYAASIATVIMQAGDERRISDNAVVLVHHASVYPYDFINVYDIDRIKEELELFDRQIINIYNKRIEEDSFIEFMDANNGDGKWMDANEALKIGLVDEVYEPYSAVACKGVDFNTMGIVAKAFGLPELENIKEVKKETNTIEEVEEMNEEQIKALAESISIATANAVLSAIDKGKEEKSAVEVEVKDSVEFKGDISDKEAVKKHIEMLRLNNLKEATDWGDPASVNAYYEAVFGETDEKAPVSNTDNSTQIVAENTKSQDIDDTIKYLKGIGG